MRKTLQILSSCMLLLIFTRSTCKSDIGDITTTNNMAYTYLAFGDSYTIGESVPTAENFPNKTIQLLKNAGKDFKAAEILATTGWTTDELQNNINNRSFTPPYNVVTLLIGVNNQYRGRPVETYKPEFENLLKQAINFAGGKADHVIVLSIPDWSVTPFAAGRDREQIAREINEYNAANKAISEKHNVHYIDITPWTREAGNDPTLLASDGLHPSSKEYARWAVKLADKIKALL